MLFANDLFVPAATRLTLALGTGLMFIIAAERRHLRDLLKGELFIKWRTWAITAPIFGAAVMGPDVVAVVFVTSLTLQALREFASLTHLPRAYRNALYLAGAASAPIAVTSLTVWRAMPPLLLIVATLLPLFMQDVRSGVRHLAYSGLGFAYVPWLLGYFLLIREHVVGGPALLLALGTSVAASDVFAFTLGKMAGRHPLARHISPNKTWEGVAGNVIGAYAGFVLMSFAVDPGLNPFVRWLLPAVVALGCVWGDLVESLIKRHFGVKDAGTALPGFGGILDRIDSLLVVLPLAYTVAVVWG
jgi:phosphatidate cytidylyltransferase